MTPRNWNPWLLYGGGGLALIVLLSVLALGAFPVGWTRGWVEQKLSEAYGAPVHIGAIGRDSAFSYSPTIAITDLQIAQPKWAGEGDLVRAETVEVQLPVWPLVTGGGLQVRTVRVEGLEAHLVRRKDGTANWAPQDKRDDGDDDGPSLASLVVEKGRFTLDDRKRELKLSGTLDANDAKGLAIAATGTFRGAKAELTAQGGRFDLSDPSAKWPFEAVLTSPILTVKAKGAMGGLLNTRDMMLEMTASGSDLKHLDMLIEAGLFNTQPIALSANVRHKGRDWFVEDLRGTVGRSKLKGRADILKRDGRTKIDATIRASQFDFDDLASDAQLAGARAKRARLGPRVIPDTRINLSKMGPTDGVIRFKADRLLFSSPSVFRSLAGTITLDHRDLRITDIVAGMSSGRLTGSMHVDSRGKVPHLTTDLSLEGSTIEVLVGAPDVITGPVRGIVRISGHGDTIREAFADADGRAAMVVESGSVNAIAAEVMGQDLGGAIGEAIDGGKDRVDLRCLIADFRATNGVFKPRTLAIDTGISVGRGRGTITMGSEAIALIFYGTSKGKAALHIPDPIRVDGTLSAPEIAIGKLSSSDKPKVGSVIETVGRSIGAALGLTKDRSGSPKSHAKPLACDTLIAAALR